MKNENFDIREFVLRHYQYFIVGILFVVLVVVLAVFSATHKKDDKTAGTEAATVQATAAVSDDTAAAIPVTTEDLQVDAYSDVNALVESYFSAMAAGDTNTLATICSTLDDNAKIRIQEKAKYTESYDSFKCYTKPGPIAQSYIVFAYYQIKFKNIDTKAPGLTSLYVCTNADGSLYVYNGDLPANISDYIKAVAAQDDVVALLNQVDQEYASAADQDATLKAFMDALPAKLDEAVANQLASGVSADAASGSSADSGATEVQVTTTDTVKIRSSADNSSADNIIATAAKGDTYTRIGEEGDWSKIKYKDTTAYIKSEFLTTAAGTTAATDAGTATDTAKTDTAAADTGKTDDKVSGKIKITASGVKVRSSMNTDADNVLGKEYQGAEFDLYMEMADGWYKINYKGQTGYVKTDYATKE